LREEPNPATRIKLLKSGPDLPTVAVPKSFRPELVLSKSASEKIGIMQLWWHQNPHVVILTECNCDSISF